MMFMSLIPMGLVVVAIVFCVRSLYRELTLEARVLTPSACAHCDHEATHSMVVAGRCPECGTPYLVGGIVTPAVRMRDHTVRSGAYAACLVIGLAGSSLVFFSLNALVPSLINDEIARGVSWLALVLVIIGAMVTAIVLRRRRVKLAVAQYAVAHEAGSKVTPGA